MKYERLEDDSSISVEQGGTGWGGQGEEVKFGAEVEIQFEKYQDVDDFWWPKRMYEQTGIQVAALDWRCKFRSHQRHSSRHGTR